MTDTPLLDASGVAKSFGAVRALTDARLTVQPSEIVALMGANGAGKSSLMRTIAGLQEPSSGSILFNGKNIVSKPQYIREKLGYLPQEFGVYPKISAERLLDHIAVLKSSKALLKATYPELPSISLSK